MRANAVPTFIVAVGVLVIDVPIMCAGIETGGDTLVQLLFPGPDGTYLTVKMHEGMILADGSIGFTPLFEIQRRVLGVTDGSTAVYQAVLDHPVSPGTMTVSDGVHHWTQADGSNHPDFLVTYSASTRNTFVLYPDSAPEAGREIVANYSRDTPLQSDNVRGGDFRLQMIRNAAAVSPLVYSAGTPNAEVARIQLEISGDLLNWERVVLSPSSLTETGALSLSDHEFTQRKSILKTDGINQVFVGRIPEIIVAGSLTITDGTYMWSQKEGSSAPDDFSVSYAPATRSIVTVYSSDVPESGRAISANYSVKTRHSLATFLRLYDTTHSQQEDPSGVNFVHFTSYQAGSYTEIDNLVLQDLDEEIVVLEDNFLTRIEDRWGLKHVNDAGEGSSSAILTDSSLTRIDGTLQLECIGYGQNGSGGYNSSSSGSLLAKLPNNFSLRFQAKRNQWAGHFHINFTPDAMGMMGTPDLSPPYMAYRVEWSGSNFGTTRQFFNDQVISVRGNHTFLTTGSNAWHDFEFRKKGIEIQVFVNGNLVQTDQLNAFNYSLIN